MQFRFIFNPSVRAFFRWHLLVKALKYVYGYDLRDFRRGGMISLACSFSFDRLLLSLCLIIIHYGKLWLIAVRIAFRDLIMITSFVRRKKTKSCRFLLLGFGQV